MRTIGLMSGTSLDGVDGVLVDFSGSHLQVLAFASLPIPSDLRAEFLALNSAGNNELHRAALASNALVALYTQVVQELLADASVPASSVAAIGAHGQTVRHRPGEFDGIGYTLQLNNPALLAERTGISVVGDFRTRDVAAGGQGAPLVPAFHSLFLNAGQQRLAVLNIGGISNITLLAPGTQSPVLGFDCGPGNALLDYWCQKNTGNAFDREGSWGRTGKVDSLLLQQLMDDGFFRRPPPKSTGRDLFNSAWLAGKLEGHSSVSATDVQATLTELTARSCVAALDHSLAPCERLLLCGGGAYNHLLVERIQAGLPACTVESSATVGIPPLQVEACAFAWLAQQTLSGKPVNLAGVTGARGERALGAIYPA